MGRTLMDSLPTIRIERARNRVHNLLFVASILFTQGPRLLRNRICWWVFGEIYRSGCWMCDGTGRIWVRPIDPNGLKVGRGQERSCMFCNGFYH